MSSQLPSQKRARHQVSLPCSSDTTTGVLAELAPPSFPSHPGPSIPIDSSSEGSLTPENYARRLTDKELTNQANQHRRQVMSIDMLSDDVLLEIFASCVDLLVAEDEDEFTKEETWRSLVHVCRRWRNVVFASPRRLNLRLVCTSRTLARDILDVWPALPLVISDYAFPPEGVDNIIALLQHSDRVCDVDLSNIPSLDLEKITAAMEKPFPELTDLLLRPDDEMETVLPDSFLGGSAPRLQSIWLNRISFPGLPNLFLSATRLVDLSLRNIPHSGYISPNSMVTALSTLTSLEELSLGFQSPRSRPDRASRRPPPPTRSLLPFLMWFAFKGVSEYLDDFVARIDAPQLNKLLITFFNDIVFDTPRLVQFISRTPISNAPDAARVTFQDRATGVILSSQSPGHGTLKLQISCRKLDWQASSLEQVLTSCLPPLSTLEYLGIHERRRSEPDWQVSIEDTQWLELLHPFTAVKSLYLSEKFAACIAPALQELVGGRTAEVLPTLQYIFVEGLPPSGPVQEAIGKFVSARQVTGHPIVVARWERDENDYEDDEDKDEDEDEDENDEDEDDEDGDNGDKEDWEDADKENEGGPGGEDDDR